MKTPHIEYVPKIDGTHVMPYVIDAYISLRKAGNIEVCDCPASGAEEAFFIKNRSGRVVAVLSFFDSANNTLTVNMGFVDSRYRGKGYYSLLWRRLVEEGTKRHRASILGYHKPTNSAILGFGKKHDRKVKYICTEHKL